jgi:hypothetical protein
MRRKNLHLLLLSLLVICFSSCTEEISEKLKAAAADEASSGSTSSSEGKVFKITSTNGEGYSHFLHLEGDSKKPCEIKAPADGWKAEDYSKNSVYAVDCVLDVEELDLYIEGADLKVDVDAGLCEYVQYAPFKYAQFQPGASQKVQYRVECDSICSELNEAYCNDFQDRLYKNYTGALAYLNNLGTSGIVYNQIASSQTCQFDYSLNNSPGPNCDSGSVATKPLEITSYESNWCDGGEVNIRYRNSEGDCTLAGTWGTTFSCVGAVGADEPTCTGAGGTWTESTPFCDVDSGQRTNEQLCTASGTWRNLDCRLADNRATISSKLSEVDFCGGDANSCFEGPSVDLIGADFYSKIWNNDSVSAFTEDIVIEPSNGTGRFTNRYAASYSRTCVNDSVKGAGVFASNSVPFLGYKMEETSEYATYTAQGIDSDNNGIDDYKAYGDHPFMSINASSGRPRYNTKPYYAINCLDQSRDVKVQIRLHVREWDRAFLKTFDFINKVSDVDRAGILDRYIDNDTIHDGDEEWNDRNDWDDFYDSSGLFPTNDCRTLDKVPSAGTCTNALYSNKEDCQTNVVRCSAPGPGAATKRIDCGTCSNALYTTPYTCAANTEVWTLEAWEDNPWISNDESNSNFPNYSK